MVIADLVRVAEPATERQVVPTPVIVESFIVRFPPPT